jgi:hypothetical protein
MNESNPETLAERSILALSGWGRLKSAVHGLMLLGATALIFYFLFRRIDIKSVFSVLPGVPPFVWLSATLITFLFPVISAIRWRLVLHTMGFEVPLARCLLIIIGIWPISTISPSKAGELLKALSLRDSIKPAVVAGSVLSERVLDVLTLALCALAGGAYFGDVRMAVVGALAACGVLSILIIGFLGIRLPFGPRIQATIEDLFRSMKAIKSRPGPLVAIVALTGANWLATFVQANILFYGLGVSIPLGFIAAALPVAIFAGLLPITIAGMATRESAMIILFSAFASSSQALSAGILYSFFGCWLLAVGGIPFTKKALNL